MDTKFAQQERVKARLKDGRTVRATVISRPFNPKSLLYTVLVDGVAHDVEEGDLMAVEEGNE